MKKNLLLFICLSFSFFLKAQDMDKARALELVTKNSSAIGLTNDDINNVIVSDAYTDHSTGLDLVYLQQTYKSLPVFNQLQVLAFRNGKPVSNAGGRIHNIEKILADVGIDASVTAAQALKTAMAAKNMSTTENLSGNIQLQGRKLNFGMLGIAQEDITAELMWVPLEDGKKIRLAWQVYLVPNKSPDYWMIRIDAKTNKIIDQNNLTVYCNWSNPDKYPVTDDYAFYQKDKQEIPGANHINFFDVKNLNVTQEPAASPQIINSATYRVIPFPAESPKHPGGTPALRTDPWSSAPGNATSLKWHSTGTTDYTITRGNNVWAKEDHPSNNSSTGQPATSTTPDPLTFNFVPDFGHQPNQTSPVQNQQFNITNLFYWVNTYHDIMYQYGFDEPAGNFQSNNQGRGGQGGDYVFADVQDGNFVAPDQNNANFASPADGGNGRMQMYLWDTAALCNVNAPAVMAGPVVAIEGAFSTANKLINVGPVTGDVVYYNDNAATTHEACVAPSNSLTGKIALIDRGNCTFVIKVKAAQTAGAIGVIMVNNVAGLLTMAGSDNTITIPAVCISQADGLLIKNQLAASVNVNVTLSAANMDGDVDNGIVMHEHTHGLSSRLTGGPSNPSCLGNAENAGEGWSDYYSLMLTQDWANSNLNTGFASPRGIGTYVVGQLPSGSGIRTQKYCTDFTINNLVYAGIIDAESHNRGELWCATLWDMTWNIINQVGIINPNLYDATGTGGNNIALRIVTQGLKLQPCSPGFIDGRNAIIAADQALYGGAHECAIREAFRRRGMGDNATQGSSNNVTDQVADFTMVCTTCTNVAVTAQPTATAACTGGSAIFSVTVSGTTPAYQWQVSIGGGPFNNIPGETAATLTLSNVTAGMSGNQYQVIITNTCPSNITSTAVALTVTDPASISSQPVNSTVCAGSNTSFSVTATGSSNTYQWQVSTGGGPFTDLPGAIAATLNLTGVTAAMNNNQYHLVVFSCGPTGLNSNNVTLTVNSPVSITAQPQNTTACVGGDATITITADGTGNTYQWQVSTGGGPFTDIPGATSGSLTVTGVSSGMNNNVYHVIITNGCTPAGVTSSNSTLTVTSAASITTQPVNTTVCAGSDAIITATASGSSYQWQVSTGGGPFTDITGATTTTLTLTGVTAAMNNNQYQLVIGSCGASSINTNPVTLTVNIPASISAQPASTVTVCEGADASFTVTAAGSSPSYQWQVSTGGGPFTNIPGATAATLPLNAVTAGMNGNQYQVVLSNSCTVSLASSTGTLTVTPPSSITTEPINAAVCEGSAASFDVQVANASGASYQWQVSNGGPFTDIPGATSSTFTIPAATSAMNNSSYHVLITACGSLTSVAAVLSVNPLPIVTITASPYVNITQDLTTTLTASSVPPSAVFSWFKDGILIPTVTGNTITVAHTDLGDYTASVTDANTCTGSSAILTIGDSLVSHAFIYPNPNGGHFYVVYPGTQAPSKLRYITIYDAKGARVYQKAFVTVQTYDKMEVHVEFLSKGTYALILYDADGKVLGKGKVAIGK